MGNGGGVPASAHGVTDCRQTATRRIHRRRLHCERVGRARARHCGCGKIRSPTSGGEIYSWPRADHWNSRRSSAADSRNHSQRRFLRFHKQISISQSASWRRRAARLSGENRSEENEADSGPSCARASRTGLAGLFARRCDFVRKRRAVRAGSEHDSGNDRSEFVTGSGRGRWNQLCRSLRAHHRTLARQDEERRPMKRQNRSRARNRRVSNRRQRRQQHLLDVKVRSRTATQHRNRRVLVFVSQFGLVIGLCVALYFGVREGARKLFFENPDYQLSTIEVQTDGTLQREQILKVADLREGENIFNVNLGRVHDRLQQLPQIDDVQVERKLPAEIDIHVVERKPVAWITDEKQMADPFASDAAFLVDGRGVLMKEKKLLPEYLGLPLISGCASESLEPGKTVESFEAKAALELLRLSTRSFMQTRFQVREIDVSKGYCLIVTDKNHTRVTFGFDNLDIQLQRLEQFLIYSDDSKRELATVNLLAQRNIPVTFTKPATEVINETIKPAEAPRIMKAIPVHAPEKTKTAPSPTQSRVNPSPTPVRRA